MITIVGPAATAQGYVQKSEYDVYSLPAGNYLKRQAANIPLCYKHDVRFTLGRVVDLDRSKLGLWPTATADDDIADMLDEGEWFFSDRVVSRSAGVLQREEARMIELSLVNDPANLGLRPVQWGIGDITTGTVARPRNMSLSEHSVWDRVCERMKGHSKYRQAPDLLIADADELSLFDLLATDPAAGRAKLAQLTAEATVARTRAPQLAEAGRMYRHHVGGRILSYDGTAD